MITLAETLERLDSVVDRPTLETYIERSWVRPIVRRQEWYFEDIDLARIRLVRHLQHDILVNDEAMDVVLNLLDQLYGMRAQMHALRYAIAQQPEPVRSELYALFRERSGPGEA